MSSPLRRVSAISGGASGKRHILVAVVYAIITIFFTYPTVLHLRDQIGGQLDALENYWNLAWVYQSLLQLRQNPFHTTWIYFPFGIPLYFHTLNILHGLMSLPIQACCGTAAAYNILNMLVFVVAALGAYALAWYLTHRHGAAFIAGLIYGFSPYMAFHLHMGQTNLLALHWLPWYLLALFKGVRERWIWLPVASVLLLFNALTDWHHAIFAILITGMFALVESFQLRRPRAMLTMIGKLALVGALFAVLASPLLLPMLREFAGDPYAARPLRHNILHSADLLAFALPSPFHPLWGEWASRIFYGRLVPPNIVGGIATLGYVAVALAVYGVVRDWRRSMLFVLLFGACAVLALGPYLQVNGVNSYDTTRPLPMPYLLFNRLPLMSMLRVPSRFVEVVMLALAMLAALGVAGLQGRWSGLKRSNPARMAVPVALALLMLFEYWPHPFRTTPIGAESVSPFFQQLGADSDEYAIVEVPYRHHPSLLAQTHHGKQLVGGKISRPMLHPWFTARFFGPLVQTAPPWREMGADNSPEAWRAALACQDVRYAVFYKQGLELRQRAGSEALEKVLFTGMQPRYEDETLRAYGPFQDQAQEAYWTPQIEDWHDAETNEQGLTYRWLNPDRGRLLAYPCESNTVILRMQVYAFAQNRTLEIRVNGQPVHTVLLPADVFSPVEVPITLRDGENLIELFTPEPALPASERGWNDDRSLSLLVGDVSMRGQ